MPIHRRRTFHHKGMRPHGVWGIRPRFHGLSPCGGQVAYVLLTSAPVAAIDVAINALPLDLHVLSLSLAFILSQDQTLRCCISFSSFQNLLSKTRHRNSSPIPGRRTLLLYLSVDSLTETGVKKLLYYSSPCTTLLLTISMFARITACFFGRKAMQNYYIPPTRQNPADRKKRANGAHRGATCCKNEKYATMLMYVKGIKTHLLVGFIVVIRVSNNKNNELSRAVLGKAKGKIGKEQEQR